MIRLKNLIVLPNMRILYINSTPYVRGVGSESHADLRPSRAHARVVAVGRVVLGPRP